MTGVLSCMSAFLVQLDGVGRDIIALPSSIGNLSSIVNTMSSSLTPALNQMDHAISLFDDITGAATSGVVPSLGLWGLCVRPGARAQLT